MSNKYNKYIYTQRKLPKWLRNICKINLKNVFSIILENDCTLVQ